MADQTQDTPATVVPSALADEDFVEADDGFDSDSAYGGTDRSDTDSITSSIYAGFLENGRKYQTLREGEYWGPSDDKQFEHMQAMHTAYQVLDSKQENRFFRAPIGEKAQNILDLGTGNGAWARDVADLLPGVVVAGIDLYPPPNTWVPPNCRLEVDDILKPWTFTQAFDLIHLRLLVGAFEDRQWHGVYKQAYENLVPGGWIEHLDVDIEFRSDDGTVPKDSAIAQWGPLMRTTCGLSGKDANTTDTMRAKIESAGFVNLHEKVYKLPVGDWAKDPVLKEAGKFNKIQFEQGMEGFAMFLLTRFGEPEPWSSAEVQVFLARMRRDLNNGAYHGYHIHRRIWAQRPLEGELAAEKAEVEVIDG